MNSQKLPSSNSPKLYQRTMFLFARLNELPSATSQIPFYKETTVVILQMTPLTSDTATPRSESLAGPAETILAKE